MAGFSFLRPASIAMKFPALSRFCVRARDSVRGFLKRPTAISEHMHHVWFALIVMAVSAICLLIGFDFVSSRVQSISQVSALTERVEFMVTQPHLAAIPVRQMRIGTGEPALDGKCIEGLIVPGLHANVIYGRVGYGPLSIRIVPPDADRPNTIAGEFEPAGGGRPLALKGSTYVETDSGCGRRSSKAPSSVAPPFDNPPPMPIWGLARIGSEFKGVESSDPEPRLLLAGQMKVSAKAIEILPSLLDLRATLYPMTVLDLPVGSRLETYTSQPKNSSSQDESDKDGPAFVPNWWGTAYADSQRPALSLEVATDTPKLALYRPNGHDPDVIEVSRMNQVFEDPNLIKLYKLLAVFAIAAAALKWSLEMSKLIFDRPNKSETK